MQDIVKLLFAASVWTLLFDFITNVNNNLSDMGLLWAKNCRLWVCLGMFVLFHSTVFCDSGTNVYGLETEPQQFYLGSSLYLTNIGTRTNDYGCLQVYYDSKAPDTIKSYAAELAGTIYATNPVSAIFLNYNPLTIKNDKLPADWPAQAVSAANISYVANERNNMTISAVSLNQDLYISPGFSSILRVYTNVIDPEHKTPAGCATFLAANNSTNTYENGYSAASVFDLHTQSDLALTLELQGSPKDSTSDSVNLTAYAAASTVAVSSSVGGSSLAISGIFGKSADRFNIVEKSANLGNGAYISSEAKILSTGNSSSSAVSAGVGAALYGCGAKFHTTHNINDFGTNIGTDGIIFSLASNSSGAATSVGIGAAIDTIAIPSQVIGGIGKTTICTGTTVAAYSSGNKSTAVGIGTAMTNITDSTTSIPLTGGQISIGANTTIIAAHVQSTADTSTAVGIGCVAGGNKMTGGSIIFKGPADVVAISNGTTNTSVAIGGDVRGTTICFDAFDGSNNVINLIALNGALSEPSAGTTFSLANPTVSKSISLHGDSKIVIGGVYNSATQSITTSVGKAPTVNIYGDMENSDNANDVQVVSGAIANMYGANTGVTSFIIDEATVNLCSPDTTNVSKTISIPSITELTAGKRKMKTLAIQFAPTAANLNIDIAGSFALNAGALLTLGNSNNFSYGGGNGYRSANSEVQINGLGTLAGGLEPSTFLYSSGQFYGLYSQNADGALLIDNTLALTGTSLLKVGTGEKIEITGRLAFVGDNCQANFGSGVITNQVASTYEFRGISGLTLSNIYNNFAHLYSGNTSTNLVVNNKLMLSNGTSINLISGDKLNISGTLAIGGTESAGVAVVDGAAFTHTPGSTFEIFNVENLNVSQFANSGAYGLLYNSGYNAGTLTIDNTLAFGGTTTMSFDAGQYINVENGSLAVRDRAVLSLDGASTGNIIGSSMIVHDQTTTFTIKNLGSLSANLNLQDFISKKYKTLYESETQEITIDNTLNLKGKTLDLGSGDTIVFRGNYSSFYSDTTKAVAQNANSSYIFLNTTITTDSFGTGTSGIRFQNLNKNINAIENNVIVGDTGGQTPSALCINKTNFTLKPGAALKINDGSALQFLRNGNSGSTTDCTISTTPGQVTHTSKSIFEFSGVTRNLQVSKFKVNSTGSYYYNLYNDATSSSLTIDNTIKLSSQGSYPSLFNVDGMLDISNGKFIIEGGSTLLFPSSTNSQIFGAGTALEKTPASIISLGSNFTVLDFETGGNLANVYQVDDKMLKIDNVLNIQSGGKLTLDSGYGVNVIDGAHLSLTSGTLSFENGNSGVTIGSSSQVTKSADSICEFKNIALSWDDFASGGKYSNLYTQSKDDKNILSIDNVLKLTTVSGTTPAASLTLNDNETLNNNETLNVAGTLDIESESTATVNSGAKISFCGDSAKVSNSGTITLNSGSTTELAGMSNVTLSTFATNGALANLYPGATSSSLSINNILELGSYQDTATAFTVGSNATMTSNGLILGTGTSLTLNSGSNLKITDNTKVTRDPASAITFNNVDLSLGMFGTGGDYQNLFSNNTIDNKVYLNGGSLTIDAPLTFEENGVFNLGSNAKIIVSGEGKISGGRATTTTTTTTFVRDSSSTCVIKKDFNIDDFASGGKYYSLYVCNKNGADSSLTIDNTLEVADDTIFTFGPSQSDVLGDGGKLKIDAGSTLLFKAGSYLTGSTSSVTLDKTSTCQFAGIDFGDNVAELFFDNSNTQNYFLGLYSCPSVNALAITNKISIESGSKFTIGQDNTVTVSGVNSAFVVSTDGGAETAMSNGNFLYYPQMHLHNALHAWDVKNDDRKSTFVLDAAGTVSITGNYGRELSDVLPYAAQAVVVPEDAFSFFDSKSLFNIRTMRPGPYEYIDDTEDSCDIFLGNVLEVNGGTTLVVDGHIGVGYSMEAGGIGGHMQKNGSRYEYIDIHGQIKVGSKSKLKFVGKGRLVFNQYVTNDINSTNKDQAKTDAHGDGFTYYSPQFNYSFFSLDANSTCEFDGIGDFGVKDFVYGSCLSKDTGVAASLANCAQKFSTLYDIDLVVPEDLGYKKALIPRVTMSLNNKMVLSASNKAVCFVLQPLALDKDKGMYDTGEACSILAIGNGAGIQLGGDNDKAKKGLKVVGSKLYNFTCFGSDQTITGPSSQWLTVKEYDPSVAENYVEFNDVGTFTLNDIGGSGQYGHIFQGFNADARIPSLTFDLTGNSTMSVGSGHIAFKGQYSRLSAAAGKVTFTTKSNGTSDAIIEIIDRGNFSTGAFGAEGTELQQLFDRTDKGLAINKTLKLSGTSYMQVDDNLNVTGGLCFEGSSASLKSGSGAISLDSLSTVTFSGVGTVPLSDFGTSGQYANLFGSDVSTGVNLNNNVNFLSLVSGQTATSTLSIENGATLNVGATGVLNVGKYCKINLPGKINLTGTLLFSEKMGTQDECRFIGTTAAEASDTVGIYLAPTSQCKFVGLGTTLMPVDFSTAKGQRFAGLYPIVDNVMSIPNTLICANDLTATSATKLNANNDVTFSVLSGNTVELQDGASLRILNCSGKYGLFFENNSCAIFHNGSTCKNGSQVSRTANSIFEFVDYADLKASDFVDLKASDFETGARFRNLYDVFKESASSIFDFTIDNKLYLKNSQLTIDENYSLSVAAQLLGDANSTLVVDRSAV